MLPSDHVVDDEAILNEAIFEALDEAGRHEWHVVLIGAPSTVPDPSLGWIIPGRTRPARGRTHAVAGFVEKPSLATATECVRRGAFRNTLMLAATAQALLKTFSLAMREWADPTQADDHALHVGTLAALAVHADLPVMDLSRDVLQQSAQSLRVLPLPECGWSDIGTLGRLRAWWGRHPTALEQVRQSGLLPDAPRTPPGARPGPAMARYSEDLVAATGMLPTSAGHPWSVR